MTVKPEPAASSWMTLPISLILAPALATAMALASAACEHRQSLLTYSETGLSAMVSPVSA